MIPQFLLLLLIFLGVKYIDSSENDRYNVIKAVTEESQVEMRMVKNMSNEEQLLLKTYIDKCAKKYTMFIEIDELPPYEIIAQTISLEGASKKGFGAFATHFYNVAADTHHLNVWSEIYKPQLHAEYLLFHEFTHILDVEMYVQRDRERNVAFRGFTEYHAAQVEFMRLLKAEKISTQISFTMNQIFETAGGRMTANDYVVKAHNLASDLIARDDFPADLETFSATLGLVFNYWGRRSICKMYASDYQEQVDGSAFEKLLGHDAYKALNVFMNGWQTETQINLIGNFYFKMFISIASKYSL